METVQTKEIWKQVEGHPFYLVSNFGRLYVKEHLVWCKANNAWSKRKGHICKPNYSNSKGYARVGIQVDGKQRQFSLHRLVALAFIPNPYNYPQVNHINGDKTDNRVVNLEWVSNQENMSKSWETGLRNHVAEKNYRHSKRKKLSEEAIRDIRNEFKLIGIKYSGKTDFYRKMTAKYNLKSISTICWIFSSHNPTHKFV